MGITAAEREVTDELAPQCQKADLLHSHYAFYLCRHETIIPGTTQEMRGTIKEVWKGLMLIAR